MHTAPTAPTFDSRLLGAFAPLAAWTCYAQLGAKYVACLGCTWLCLNLLRRQGRLADLWRDTTTRWLLAFLALLALSATWSPAPWGSMRAHLWTYGLLLLAAVIAAGCPPRVAERALTHFVWASAVVGGLFVLRAANLFTTDPASRFWMATLEATGNQRVVTSLLLAIGASLGLWLGARQPSVRARAMLILPSLLAMAGLVLQDRRTGMVVLPVMLLVWALASQRGPARKAAGLAAVALVVGIGWMSSDTVRQRFAEGVAELRQYRPNDQVDTSWGQRVRMLQLTSEMVRERPLLGHGVASWQTLWQQRVTPGTALAVHSTPHNEYLLFTVQAGLLGLALFLVWLGRTLVAAARSGPAGVGALMLWTAMAMSALFNAVFRDAKFALPLLLLAGLAGALAHADRRDAMGQSSAWPAPR